MYVPRWIYHVSTGVAIGGTAFVWMEIPAMISGAAGLVSFVALTAALGGGDPELDTIAIVDGMTRKQRKFVLKSIKDGQEKVANIRSLADDKVFNKLHSHRRLIMDICDIGDKIFDVFRENPKSIYEAGRFLEYTIEYTNQVISEFITVQSRYKDDVENDTVKNFNKALQTLQKEHFNQHEALKKGDMAALGSTMTVIQQMSDLRNGKGINFAK